MNEVYKSYRRSLLRESSLRDRLGWNDDNETSSSGNESPGHSIGTSIGAGSASGNMLRSDPQISEDERQFLQAVERGDHATVKKYLIDEHHIFKLNKNCTDAMGRSALLISIDNENLEICRLLIEHNVDLGDALLHAINEEFIEAVQLILDRQQFIEKRRESRIPAPSNSFTPDITPIILAAHKDNYEIIKMLLDRGETIPHPHDVHCGCDECIKESSKDSLRASLKRINAYKALASPCLICLSSKDPILTSFELSWELKRLSRIENEFKLEYEKLAEQCRQFSCDLLNQTRTSYELKIILNHEIGAPTHDDGESMALSRLKLAVKYKQKMFVAHPHVQQLLASLWYEGLPGFRRSHIAMKLGLIFLICSMFPMLSLLYIIAPRSPVGSIIRKPFIKFICQSASYFTFLFLLILVSQRFDLYQDEKAKAMKEIRGAPPTQIEWLILAWVLGLIWVEIKQIWCEGAKSYIHDMWNLLDFITNTLLTEIGIPTITLRIIAYLRVEREKEQGNPMAYLERQDWDAFDPNLIAESMFAAANIFSQLKLVYIFTVNAHLGPLQISLGRMVVDIMKWGFVFLMVLFAFACGLNQLYWYYAFLRQQECKKMPPTYKPINPADDPCSRKFRTFANLFEIVQSLYWALYGLIDLDSTQLKEQHTFTEFIGKVMFGAYSMISVIVLINMLIAMMSSSYSIISSDADMEWKFARSRLWISYFEEGATCPPPFNIIPSLKAVLNSVTWLKNSLNIFRRCQTRRAESKWQSIRKIVRKVNEREIRYQAVMRDLIKRYIMNRQRVGNNAPVTGDDMHELRHDVSQFRFELMEILKNNGMTVPESLLAKHRQSDVTGGRRQRNLFAHKTSTFEFGGGTAGSLGSFSSELSGQTTRLHQQTAHPNDEFTHGTPTRAGESLANTVIMAVKRAKMQRQQDSKVEANSIHSQPDDIFTVSASGTTTASGPSRATTDQTLIIDRNEVQNARVISSVSSITTQRKMSSGSTSKGVDFDFHRVKCTGRTESTTQKSDTTVNSSAEADWHMDEIDEPQEAISPAELVETSDALSPTSPVQRVNRIRGMCLRMEDPEPASASSPSQRGETRRKFRSIPSLSSYKAAIV